MEQQGEVEESRTELTFDLADYAYAPFDAASLEALSVELIEQGTRLSSLCLYDSAKWILELVDGLASDPAALAAVAHRFQIATGSGSIPSSQPGSRNNLFGTDTGNNTSDRRRTVAVGSGDTPGARNGATGTAEDRFDDEAGLQSDASSVSMDMDMSMSACSTPAGATPASAAPSTGRGRHSGSDAGLLQPLAWDHDAGLDGTPSVSRIVASSRQAADRQSGDTGTGGPFAQSKKRRVSPPRTASGAPARAGSAEERPPAISEFLGLRTPQRPSSTTPLPAARVPAGSTVDWTANRQLVEGPERLPLALARAYFDGKEFLRAADCLAAANCRSLEARFLGHYARFMHGQKRKHERQWDAAAPDVELLSDALAPLVADLAPDRQAGCLNGPCLWLLGVALREQGRVAAARAVLCDAVAAEPLLWCAWRDLALTVDRDPLAVLRRLPLPNHWMKYFFLVDVLLEVQHNVEALRMAADLAVLFPRAVQLQTYVALGNYNLREFDTAEMLFARMREQHPNRLEALDSYSNVLFVREDAAKLSVLARAACETDRHRPETCTVIGNYMSLRGEHEKAVVYFRRSLQLNPRNLYVWTLMGHEFIELKNTEAAVEAYRKAVDTNPRDYRAWYGLGQAYELLRMPLYSLYYYRKAAALRPYDARMFNALAALYERLSLWHEAIACYERAVANGDREGVSYPRLARICSDKLHDSEAAAYYYRRHLDALDAVGAQTPELIEALQKLAEHCMTTGLWDDSEQYCYRLLDFAGKEKDLAKGWLREIAIARQKESQK